MGLWNQRNQNQRLSLNIILTGITRLSISEDGDNLIFTDWLLQKAEIGKNVDDMNFKIYKVALSKKTI